MPRIFPGFFWAPGPWFSAAPEAIHTFASRLGPAALALAMSSAGVSPLAHEPLAKVAPDLSYRQETFRETLRNMSPLVSIDHIKDHLLFIGAWVRFYQETEDAGTLATLLARGVHRFEIWLERIVPNSSADNGQLQLRELPPFDVAMMLHACMLSPHRYYEDGLTRLPQLLAVGAFPLKDIAALIDPRTYIYKATSEQMKYWEDLTGIPFDPLDCKETVHDVTIKCPSCEMDLSVAWESNGCGYGEDGFLCTCTRCGSSVSHDSLCMAKLLKDLTDYERSDEVTMRGTLLNNRGDIDPARGRLITLHVLKTLRKEKGTLPTPTETDLKTFLKNLNNDEVTDLRQARSIDLLRPYTQSTPFTHDLARAITELAQFHWEISGSGGCSPQFLSGPCSELNVACEKYNAFLELIAFPEVTGGAVPSSDLDLVWHTHQLDGRAYKETIVALTDVFADHLSCSENPDFFAGADKETRRRWDESLQSSVPLHVTKLVFNTHAEADADSHSWKPRIMRIHPLPCSCAPEVCPSCGGKKCDACGQTGFKPDTNCGNSRYR